MVLIIFECTLISIAVSVDLVALAFHFALYKLPFIFRAVGSLVCPKAMHFVILKRTHILIAILAKQGAVAVTPAIFHFSLILAARIIQFSSMACGAIIAL